MLCALEIVDATEQENLIGNPGLETSRLEVDDGIDSLHLRMMEPGYWWAHHANPDRAARYSWDRSAARSGAFGVSIDTRAVDPSPLRYEAWSSQIDVSGLAQRTVKLRVHTMLVAAGSAAVELRIHAFRGDHGGCRAVPGQSHSHVSDLLIKLN